MAKKASQAGCKTAWILRRETTQKGAIVSPGAPNLLMSPGSMLARGSKLKDAGAIREKKPPLRDIMEWQQAAT